MEIYIDTHELITALSRVQGIVDKASAGKAILSHVCLQASEDKLVLTATDSNLTLQAEYQARVEESGSVCVKAQRFFQIAKSLGDQTTHIKLNNKNRLEVTAGKAKFRIAECQNGNEFPPTKQLEIQSTIKISSMSLKRLIDETVFSIIDNERAGLNGAHLEYHQKDGAESSIRMITTDGNRLSFSEGKIQGSVDQSVEQLFSKMLLPRKSLIELRKLCENQDDIWEIGFGAREAEFSKPGLSLMINLVDGQFPDYRPVLNALMSKPNKREATIYKKDLLNVFKRVSIFSSKSDNSVTFDFNEGGVILSTSNPDYGDFNEDLEVDFVGNPIKVAFNLRYFQDILNAVDGEYLRFELGDVLDPCIIRISDRDDCKFIVMPMRLN